MKRVLVAGCDGQLGRCVRSLVEGRADYSGIYAGLHASETAEAVRLDVCDAGAVEELVARVKPDYVVNCTAYTNVDGAEDDAEACRLLNVDGVRNLAEACSRHGARLIHVSTDYVFDGTGSRPYIETDPTNPVSVYGRTKLEGERQVERILPGQSVILRTAWLYSVYGRNFVKTMLRLGAERDEIGVVADQRGTPTYAPVLAEAVLRVMDSVEWHPGLYHFTGKGQTTWYDFTREIFRIAGVGNCAVKPLTTEQYPTKASRPAYSALDTGKFERVFGMEIPGWEDSLRRFFVDINR